MSARTYVVERLIGEPNYWDGGGKPEYASTYYTFAAEGIEKLCSIGRKDNPVTVGEEIYATVKEETPKLLKLKSAKRPDENFGSSNAGGKWDPGKDARITRMHSQEMAIRTLELAGLYNVESAKFGTTKEIVQAVKVLANAYDKDADDAGIAANALPAPSTDHW